MTKTETVSKVPASTAIARSTDPDLFGQAAQPVGRRVSVAWRPFEKQLATVLAVLEEDQFLVVSHKHTKRFVQFAAQGAFGMRAETVSNAYLEGRSRLGKRQLAGLVKAGWLAPTGTPEGSIPELDPDGSPNFFMDLPAPVPFERLAGIAVRTLSEVLRVPYPGMLQYEAFDIDGNAILLPSLGLKRVAPRPPAQREAELMPDPQPHGDPTELLLAAMKRATNIDDLEFDGDGDIGISFGGRVAFARLVGKAPYVLFFSALATEVEETPEVHAWLNEMNTGALLVNFFIYGGVVYAGADIPANPLVGGQVVNAWHEFCRIVAEAGDKFKAMFAVTERSAVSPPSRVLH